MCVCGGKDIVPVHTMTAFVGVCMKPHLFLTLALHAGGGSSHTCCCSTSAEHYPCIHWIYVRVGAWSGLDTLVGEKKSCLHSSYLSVHSTLWPLPVSVKWDVMPVMSPYMLLSSSPPVCSVLVIMYLFSLLFIYRACSTTLGSTTCHVTVYLHVFLCY